MNPTTVKALTVRGKNGLLRALVSDVGICEPFLGDPSEKQKDLKIASFKGVWDTGAMGSVITRKVVDELGLKPTGQKDVHTANGPVTQNTYLVNMTLPGDVMIQHVQVTEGNLSNIDVLIGMDIITLGDFSITNKGGITVMSFRVPSCVEVDYVQEIRNNGQLNRHGRRALGKSR